MQHVRYNKESERRKASASNLLYGLVEGTYFVVNGMGADAQQLESALLELVLATGLVAAGVTQ